MSADGERCIEKRVHACKHLPTLVNGQYQVGHELQIAGALLNTHNAG